MRRAIAGPALHFYISGMSTVPKIEAPKRLPPERPASSPPAAPKPGAATEGAAPTEIGGRKGPEPTRYGDWEKDGRCIDF